MKKMMLLFSHKLTEEQRVSAKKELECTEFISLPTQLQNYWSNVSPYKEEKNKLEKIKKYVKENCNVGDYALIQGEWGYVFEMVKFCKEIGIVGIYSTTNRESKEMLDEDGNIIKTSIFKHIRYKFY